MSATGPMRGIKAGDRICLPDSNEIVVVAQFTETPDGCSVLASADPDSDEFRRWRFGVDDAKRITVLNRDGAGPPATVLAGFWTEWLMSSVRSARSTVLASTTLRPFPHQMTAVYERMLPQPILRFLLADEPGTGKTIMSGLWLREAQRLGKVKRALVVCPAHLVLKWQADFDDFFGGGLREVSKETIDQRALSASEDDTWVVSLHLAAQNPAVREALRPKEAGWDAIIFDEAHRLTPTAETFHRVGTELAGGVLNALFLTATPHRGDEYLFRELLHLVDPDVFPSFEGSAPVPEARLSPGPLHFLRRMKEDLVDYDYRRRLFNPREADNIRILMDPLEQSFHNRALDLVARYFPRQGRQLAAMVYGKRAASSMYALAETLRRRSERMGSDPGLLTTVVGDDFDDHGEDRTERSVVSANSLDPTGERREVSDMLSEIEPLVSFDATPPLDASKWRPMMERLGKHGITPGNDGRLVVFTEYADTADWLVSRFRRAGFTCRRYSGADDHAQRAQIQADFMKGRFDVMVSTDAGNEGVDMQAANVLVNWDIPWSLVRLEQRMGRIHRIGQKQKVWLYNLIALGTREGEAHDRLLDRLIEAANELGGKMFDSLDAIMERLISRGSGEPPHRLLRHFYATDGQVATADGMIPTLPEIQAERDAYFTELSESRSLIDVDAANAAHRDDREDRVNPAIVERFLERVKDAGLLRIGPVAMDEGFYKLSAPPGSRWHLPPALASTDGATLVATRADVRGRAISEGLDQGAAATMLGPGDPALALLLDSLRDRLQSDMYRGATLADLTSDEDYTLLVYECDITEGADEHSSRRPPPKRTHSWLIRVGGETRCVSWGLLPNLSVEDATAPRPLQPNIMEAAEDCATAAASSEHARRAAALQTWAAQLDAQLDPLPNALTDHIGDRKERNAQRLRIEASVSKRLDDARAAATITFGKPRLAVWANVKAPAVPPDDTEPSGDSEEVSMRLITELLESHGWAVTDVHTERCGYDMVAIRGAEQQFVEVKGRSGDASSSGIMMTGGELLQAAQKGDEYWLYVVHQCADGTGAVYGKWRNPVETFPDAFKDVPTWRLPGGELKAALDKQSHLS